MKQYIPKECEVFSDFIIENSAHPYFLMARGNGCEDKYNKESYRLDSGELIIVWCDSLIKMELQTTGFIATNWVEICVPVISNNKWSG